MSLPKSELLYTIAEYLAFERKSAERHEYLDGYVYAMAGESRSHADISSNLMGELNPKLRGTTCRVWTKDTKVLSNAAMQVGCSRKGLFSYPDLVIVCGEPQYLDEQQDILINPTIIIEVLSPSTKDFDRGEKFFRYRTHLRSLKSYLIIHQVRPLVEHFIRQSDDEWLMSLTGKLSDSVYIPAINCSIRLADIYDRVTFPENPDQDEEDETIETIT